MNPFASSPLAARTPRWLPHPQQQQQPPHPRALPRHSRMRHQATCRCPWRARRPTLPLVAPSSRACLRPSASSTVCRICPPSMLHRTPRHGATQLTLAHERAPHRSMGRAACRRVWLRVLGAHEPVQLWPRLAAVGCRGDPHQVRVASRRLGTVPPATRLTSSTVQVLRQLCTRGSDASA